MIRKILAVAGPEWQSALAEAAGGFMLDSQTAAQAIICLASSPNSYRALVIDTNAAGVWLETLLDLTLGDTDQNVALLILGEDFEAVTPEIHARLAGTARLSQYPDRLQLEAALRAAAASTAGKPSPERSMPAGFSHVDDIRIRYQPVVRLADMQPSTLEVLARVLTKDGTLLGPGTIIKAMTEPAHTLSLTGFIINLALREREAGQFAQLDLNLAFNLPLDALLFSQLLPALETIRQLGHIPAKALRLELTETQPVTNLPELKHTLAALFDAGYRLALDDITPATPNLAGLLELPFRAIKLDRSVVTNALHPNPAIAGVNREFIASVTAQAQQTGRAVIAEGIESEVALDLMRALQVTHGQGYYFARPLPARALRPWLDDWLRRH